MCQKRSSWYNHLPSKRILVFILALSAALLSACAPAAGTSPASTPARQATRQALLTPYRSATPVVSATPQGSTASTEAPTLTPTPRTHTVKKGEDMGGIAYTYRISLEALMAANPDVMPNLMSIGTVLIIPPSKTAQPDTGTQSGDQMPTPTAIPLDVGSLVCNRVDDGGVWCFLPVHNNQEIILEGMTAIIRLSGAQPEPVLSQPAFSLIDTLPAGAVLPLTTYFPPEQVAGLTPPYSFSAEIQSTLPSADDGRYLPVRLEQQKVVISENGLAAAVTTLANLESSGGSAGRLWIAAVAYDAQGNVVGIRRWENTAGQPLKGGHPMTVSFSVYSTAGAIERVELFAEARP